jgi:L-alanine-DL-glutamate epimerase-like enolase superfamily enzyme
MSSDCAVASGDPSPFEIVGPAPLAGQALEHYSHEVGCRASVDCLGVQTDELWSVLLMSALELKVTTEKWPLREPFRISGYVMEHTEFVVVTLSDGRFRGRGEASGVYYLKDDVNNMLAGIEAHRSRIESGIDRESLQRLMPPGGGRNALDCAFWELEAARAGTPVWKLAGLSAANPLVTTFTLGADDPQKMAGGARKYSQARSLKLKLTGDLDVDVERVRAVRAARPEVWMAVDANQGYGIDSLSKLIDTLVAAKVSLIEQPLPRGREADLEGFACPIPLAADESVQGLVDLPTIPGRFDTINIKLDKCGGLTEALAMAREARRMGLGVMVGNMVGSSLAMAPAYVVGQLCDVVDLDGPIFLTQDRPRAIRYQDGRIHCGEDVWGSPVA